MAKTISLRVILIGLVLAFVVQSLPAQEPTINTVVGGGFYSQNSQPTAFSVGIVSAVAVDSIGNLYIADITHGAVYSINASTGNPTVLVGNGTLGATVELTKPTGLAVDTNGNLFIADQGAGVVYRVSTSGGMPQVVAGCGTANNPKCSVFPNIGDGGPATAAYLQGPASVAVDRGGNLYIADNLACRIRKVSSVTGTINTVAGSNCGSSGDGDPATQAQLDHPSGVAVDSAGNIFIAQQFRVREVCASSAGPCGGAGYITTVAGGGTGRLGRRWPSYDGDPGSYGGYRA